VRFAQYMTIHALEATGGLYYSQMPRYATTSGEGTNERNWAEQSYMATQVSLFRIVVGIALLLSGFGFAILSIARALRNPDSALRFLVARRERVRTPGATPSPRGRGHQLVTELGPYPTPMHDRAVA
jgi:hypothetical protein